MAAGQLPAEYMAALISSVMDTKDKVPFFVAQAEQMGIEILPPDVNLSDHQFMVVEGNIRFGLDAVKGVGHAAVEAIKAAREGEGGPFTSLWDFCERVDARCVNKKAIEALIKCGAFGSTGATRKGMLEVLEAAQAAGQKAQLDAQIGQSSIFDLAGFGEPAAASRRSRARRTRRSRSTSTTATTLLALEKESVGLFISEHPLKSVREALAAKVGLRVRRPRRPQGRRLGEDRRHGVRGEEDPHPRRAASMMFATIDDLEGNVEVRVFEKALDVARRARCAEDNIVIVRGRVDHMDGGKICVIVSEATLFEPSEREIEQAKAAAARQAERVAVPLKLPLDATPPPADRHRRAQAAVRRAPGGDGGRPRGRDVATGPRRLRLGPGFTVTTLARSCCRSSSTSSRAERTLASPRMQLSSGAKEIARARPVAVGEGQRARHCQ